MTTEDILNAIEKRLPVLKHYAKLLSKGHLINDDDLIQDMYTNVLKKPEKYTITTSFCKTLIHNIFLNYLKKDKCGEVKVYYLSEIEQQEYLHHFTEDDKPPEDETAATVRKLIERLPDLYRIPFEMYLNGASYRQICDQLDISHHNVTKRLSRARKMIHKMYYENLNYEQ